MGCLIVAPGPWVTSCSFSRWTSAICVTTASTKKAARNKCGTSCPTVAARACVTCSSSSQYRGVHCDDIRYSVMTSKHRLVDRILLTTFEGETCGSPSACISTTCEDSRCTITKMCTTIARHVAPTVAAGLSEPCSGSPQCTGVACLTTEHQGMPSYHPSEAPVPWRKWLRESCAIIQSSRSRGRRARPSVATSPHGSWTRPTAERKGQHGIGARPHAAHVKVIQPEEWQFCNLFVPGVLGQVHKDGWIFLAAGARPVRPCPRSFIAVGASRLSVCNIELFAAYWRYMRRQPHQEARYSAILRRS